MANQGDAQNPDRRDPTVVENLKWMKWTTVATALATVVNLLALASYLYVSLGQNRLTRESIEHENRPWITVRHGFKDQIPKVEPGKGPITEITFENTGKSPAQNVVVRHRTSVQRLDWKPPENLPEPADVSRGALGPGQTRGIVMGDDLTLNADHVAFIEQRRELTIYYHGEIAYTDQFSKTPRRTEFCLYYLVNKTPRGTIVVALGFCSTHNDVT